MSKWAAHPHPADRPDLPNREVRFPELSWSSLGNFSELSDFYRKSPFPAPRILEMSRDGAAGGDSLRPLGVARGSGKGPLPTHRTIESRMEGSARRRDAPRGRAGRLRGLRPPKSVRPGGLSTHLGSAVRPGTCHPASSATRATHAELQKAEGSAKRGGTVR